MALAHFFLSLRGFLKSHFFYHRWLYLSLFNQCGNLFQLISIRRDEDIAEVDIFLVGDFGIELAKDADEPSPWFQNLRARFKRLSSHAFQNDVEAFGL